MIHDLINFSEQVKNDVVLLTSGRYAGMYAIDINQYGLCKYNSDPENGTIYRNSITQIVHEFFDFDTDSALEEARLSDAYADEMTLNGR